MQNESRITQAARKWLDNLKWRIRLRNLPTESQLDAWDNQVFISDIRWKLAMAKHEDFLDQLKNFRPY